MSTSAGTKSGYRQVAWGVGVPERVRVVETHLHDRQPLDGAVRRALPSRELVTQVGKAPTSVGSEQRLEAITPGNDRVGVGRHRIEHLADGFAAERDEVTRGHEDDLGIEHLQRRHDAAKWSLSCLAVGVGVDAECAQPVEIAPDGCDGVCPALLSASTTRSTRG